MADLISASLSAEDKQLIIDSIVNATSKLPFVVLTKYQRKILPAMDMERRPFVEDALVRGENDPTILPSFVKPAELRKDLVLYGDISEIYVVVEALFTRVSDLLHAAGSDAYIAALAIYNSAKMAQKAGMPGAEATVNELKKLFEKQGESNPPATPVQ
jgi:hypothetical protein